ncbi:hypothetical protein ACFYL6_15640 [Micromonospora sp. NPDC007208]|uniref:DUF7668 domain-containing protein n=1 Tax=Micromonospora sp. NPDC007208 TaxID=3364236 RepID=UPI0036BDC653
MIVEPAMGTALQVVLGLLADREYETLASMTGEERLSADEIRTAVESYGRTVVRPPGDGLPPDLDVIEVEGEGRRRVAATMSLWTVEEGRSDLSLQLLLTEIADGLWTVRLDDIRTL